MEKNDLILITGANGYISSHVVDQALAAGYRVRGAVRKLDSTAWLQDYLDEKYGHGRFERVAVSNYCDQGALDHYLDDIAGIIHIATDTALSGEPEPYVTNSVNSIINVLESATQHSVKRFVYTTSSMAAFEWKVDIEWDMPSNGYNERAIKEAYTPPFEQSKTWTVYAAAKAIAEKAAWKWVDENKPAFDFNTILPNANFGPSLVPAQQGLPSTGSWPKMLFDGKYEAILSIPPQHFVDVRDTARVHLLALTQEEVKNERLFAFAEPYNWNSVLAILRRMYPEKTFDEDIPGVGKDLGHPPNERAEDLLKYSGQADGWIPIEQSIQDALTSIQWS